MTAAVIIPTRPGDVHRARALDYVRAWWATNFPKLPVVLGELPDDAPWSKGAAINTAISGFGTPPEVLILADADSFTAEPATITAALASIANGKEWVVPHGNVYRLRDDETALVLAGHRPRLGRICRSVYEGPAGGGITVLTRAAWDTVGGIDPRFEGWGGEDVAFGWALETLVHPTHRCGGRLVHLWHPHPAPNLRGSPDSEALVAKYTAARGFTRRMRSVIAGGDPVPAEPLADPVRFRLNANRKAIRLSGHTFIRFTQGIYETTDPDEADALRRHPAVTEETRRDATVRHRR